MTLAKGSLQLFRKLHGLVVGHSSPGARGCGSILHVVHLPKRLQRDYLHKASSHYQKLFHLIFIRAVGLVQSQQFLINKDCNSGQAYHFEFLCPFVSFLCPFASRSRLLFSRFVLGLTKIFRLETFL